VVKWLQRSSLKQLQKRAKHSEREPYNLGNTFSVHTQADVIDRILPFDVIPRILTAKDWRIISLPSKRPRAGLSQMASSEKSSAIPSAS
jgi:uncharacterized circularly permuted ATP-grasp superfamily protein